MTQVERDHPIEDVMGVEILPGDVYYIISKTEVVLEQNLAAYFAEFYDAEKRIAGEDS